MREIGPLIKRIYEDRKARFLFVGGLNTAFGYGVYALFIYIGMHYFFAQLFGNVLAVAHSYLWNKYFTFRSRKGSLSEVLRFSSVYAVSYLLNLLLLFILIDRCGVNAYAAGFAGIFITTLISYFGHKRISFKNAQEEAVKSEDKSI